MQGMGHDKWHQGFCSKPKETTDRARAAISWIVGRPKVMVGDHYEVKVAATPAPPAPTKNRGFLPWRFSDAGLGRAGPSVIGPASENLHRNRHRRHSPNGDYGISVPLVLIRLDVGRPDHLAPLLGFVGNVFAEVGGRAWKHSATKVGK